MHRKARGLVDTERYAIHRRYSCGESFVLGGFRGAFAHASFCCSTIGDKADGRVKRALTDGNECIYCGIRAGCILQCHAFHSGV